MAGGICVEQLTGKRLETDPSLRTRTRETAVLSLVGSVMRLLKKLPIVM